MAEQNRKTAEQRLWRMKAEKVVDQYLDYIFCDADGESIAREGRSVMGIYADFHGDPPSGSGFSGFCTLAAKVDRMRLRHATDWMIAARDVMIQVEPDQREAVCIDQVYRGKVKVAIDPFTQERVEIEWNDDRCASLMGISAAALRKRISRGYREVERLLTEQRQQAA